MFMVLITDNPHWIWILPRDRRPFQYISEYELLEHNGKWVILGNKPYLMDLAFRIDRYVEDGKIDAAKLSKKDPAIDPLPHVKEYAMCVYSDDRKRDEVASYLHKLGVTHFEWKYDRQSLEDWTEGGILAQEAAKHGRKVDPKFY